MKHLLLLALFVLGSAMLTACGTPGGGRSGSQPTTEVAPTDDADKQP
jgi:hypothetical protein